MTGPIGGTGFSSGLDLTVLTGWFNARALGASLSSLGSLQGAKAPAAPAVLTPWDFRQTQPTESARLRDALRTSGFVEEKDATFARADVPDSHRKLFALYKALARLETLAAEAARDGTLSGRLPGLDGRFQSGLGEVLGYVNALKIDGLTLLAGAKSARADASVAVPLASSVYTGGVAVRGAFADPIPGIAGNEQFTLRVRKAGADTDLVIDLAEIGGPVTMEAVANLVNSKLQTAGMLTRFKFAALERNADGQATAYGFKIDGVATEAVSFTAAAAAPAVYLGGISGAGGTQTGQLVKFAGVESGAPAVQFSRTAAGEGASEIFAMQRDSAGNVYTVGWASGAAGGETLQAARDAVVQKFDSAGQLVWSRSLGAAESAEGFALAVDGSDNVVVAGRVTGRLGAASAGGGGDSFVTKFNAAGAEVFTRQVAPAADDQATALAIGSDGAIYVAGQTRAAMNATVTAGGGWDVYVQKLSSSGSLLSTRQFGGAGDERATGIALSGDGGLYLASVESGQAVVRRFDASDAAAPAIWEMTLGDLQGGQLGRLAVSGGQVFVTGTTANGALDAGGQAAVAHAASGGGGDAFVFGLTDNGTSAAADFVSYVGTGALDRGFDLAVAGGAIYLAGDTRGLFPGENGTFAGASNAFLARLDLTGALDWVRQVRGAGGQSSARALAVDTSGASVLDALGLPKGRIAATQPDTLDAFSTLRAGDSFTISSGGRKPATITIAAGETLRSLAAKINAAIFLDGKASVRSTPEGERLRIEAREGKTIELGAGPADFDALRGLGLAAGKIVFEARKPADADQFEPSRIVGLGLAGAKMALTSQSAAKEALRIVAEAMAGVRSAYRALTYNPEVEKVLRGGDRPSGPVPADVRLQLANYQAGLARLTAGSGGGGFF